jgi:hypothetical protein
MTAFLALGSANLGYIIVVSGTTERGFSIQAYTQGGSPVREYRPPGSVRRARRKARPYRDPRWIAVASKLRGHCDAGPADTTPAKRKPNIVFEELVPVGCCCQRHA